MLLSRQECFYCSLPAVSLNLEVTARELGPSRVTATIPDGAGQKSTRATIHGESDEHIGNHCMHVPSSTSTHYIRRIRSHMVVAKWQWIQALLQRRGQATDKLCIAQLSIYILASRLCDRLPIKQRGIRPPVSEPFSAPFKDSCRAQTAPATNTPCYPVPCANAALCYQCQAPRYACFSSAVKKGI